MEGTQGYEINHQTQLHTKLALLETDVFIEILSRTSLKTLHIIRCTKRHFVPSSGAKNFDIGCLPKAFTILATALNKLIFGECDNADEYPNKFLFVCKPTTLDAKSLSFSIYKYIAVKFAMVVTRSNPLHFKIILLSYAEPSDLTNDHGYENFQVELFHSTTWEWRDLGALKWRWELDPSGTYPVSSLRNYIDSTILPCSDEKWQWNPLIIGKLNILAWRISYGRLPTIVNLSKIGITQSNLCKICGVAPETENHLFIECGTAKDLWQRIAGWWRLMDPNVQAIKDLLNCKSVLKGHKRLEIIHEGIMLVFLWVIWNFRNLKAHSSGAKSLSVLAYEVQSMSAFWINARNRKGVSLRWLDWCCDPIRECYANM
ncbi:unnamed protein product [Lactuca saligna]|uniref:Reverse transcriptase zinc-binding domain-containing protein n=1 Tax=Lactuca saligna TaxID=75948 RepID=A0AA35Z1C7_LACSI|nr:unnamed protein product [Lactuca saligna]